MALNAVVSTNILAALTRAVGPTVASAPVGIGEQTTITAPLETMVMHHKRYTVAATLSQALDLNAGTLLDPFGRALVFTSVQTLLLINHSTEAAQVFDVASVGVAPFKAVAAALTSGSRVLWVRGSTQAVTGAGTLTLTNTGELPADIEVLIIGEGSAS